MREIKFRAWDKARNEMFRHGELYINLKGEIFIDLLKHKDNGKRFILMQYTGLKDKNDKEICEGDIYKIIDTDVDDNGNEVFTEKTYTVEYKKGVCSIGFQFMSHPSNCEVIGNIYESKELLDEKD